MAKPSPDIQKVVPIQRWQIGVNVLLQIAVIFIIVIMLNYLAFRHFKRWDFSREHQYELSSQTKNILSHLEKPVKAVIFFTSAAELTNDLSALLREYSFASDNKFNVEVVDPYRNLSRAQELVGKYKMQANDNIVILDYDGRSKFINAADMVEMEKLDQMQTALKEEPKIKVFKGEQAITSALMELTAGKPNKVYFVSGHGEPDIDGEDYTDFKELLKRQNIQTQPLNLLDAGKIPADARALVIYGAKYDLSKFEITLLNDFWLQHGGFFIYLNPVAKTPTLNEWLASQSVELQNDRIYGLRTYAVLDDANVPTRIAKKVSSQVQFTIIPNKSPINKDLGGVTKDLLGYTQSLKLVELKAEAARLRTTPLIQTGTSYWGETDLLGNQETSFFDSNADHMGPLTIAASVERGGIADVKSLETSRMIVVGNSEMLSNKESRLAEEITLNFTVNGLNWLLSHEEATGISPRQKKSVTITMSTAELTKLGIILGIGIPGCVAIAGLGMWILRRS